MLKLAYKYMCYYKSQTFAIFVSIVLTAALLSGVSSLLYSSRMNELENSKLMYGDWHYYVNDGQGLLKTIKSPEVGDGFCLEQAAKVEIKDVVTEPYPIYFMNVDEAYRKMVHCKLKAGTYPKGQNEIAADRYTLGNLGFYGQVGDTLSLNGKEYTLTGIIQRASESDSDEMNIFVSRQFVGRGSKQLLYLRFDEKEKLYKQLDAFLARYKINSDDVTANKKVVGYLSGEKPDNIIEIIKFALTNEKGNFTYVVLKLQEEYNVTFNGMILLLCLFSLFVIYSIFTISVSKRTSEYGMMQTLGITDGKIGGTLILELWILFFIGYPVGCFIGNGLLKLCYQNLNGVFSAIGVTTNVELSGTDQFYTNSAMNVAFHVSWDAVIVGCVFLFVALAGVGFFTVHKMRRQSVRQLMSGDISYIIRNRKIYSLKRYNLVPVLVRKFMFSNKKKVTGILLSLSIGGCIFLCTTYLTENLKIHAEMSMKSDDGLESEYRISVSSNEISDTIPKSVVKELKDMSQLSRVYATKYTLGEITIGKHELEWKEYFDEANRDDYFRQKFGGICVEKENGTYGIKYDVYGYDAGMLEQLQEYVLEGEIIPKELADGNKIVVVANQDGQGNYNFYGKHPGDKIKLKVPCTQNASSDVLKFRSSEDHYVEKTFEIVAIVSRALAQENRYLNVNLWNNMQSVILTNQQMKSQFGITDYSFINASPAQEVDTDVAGNSILRAIQDIPKAVLKDYTLEIKTQKNYLRQKQAFFSGIAVILLIISLFHIMNSMNYTILYRKREFGIMRAMGITDIGFYKMILKMGLLYGLLANIFIFLLYNCVLRKIMDYYMVHVVQFLHYTATVPNVIFAGIMILNILIAVVAVFIPAKKIVGENIISEI